MRSLHRPCWALALACASPALAQDSVSKIGLMPGDAVSAYELNEQVNDFVVDKATFSSGWGNTYGLAPLMKGSELTAGGGQFFTQLMSAQAVSRDTLSGVPFARDSYMYWNAQGFGIHNNPLNSDPGAAIDTSSMTGSQFAAMFSEFTYGLNNTVGALVNYDPDVPGRLYVSRVYAAQNSPDYTCSLSQHGVGSVNAAGDLVIRADGYGGVDGCGLVNTTGNNYWSIELAQRANGGLNILHDGGATDAGASTRVISNSADVAVTPAIMPDGRLLGTTFSGQYVWEDPMGTANFSFAHLPAAATSTRGSLSFSTEAFPGIFGASATGGTAALVGMDANMEFSMLVLWGVAANGAPVGSLQLDLPAVMLDNSTGWPSDTLGTGPLQFGNHGSQTPFRGGNGQIAVGRDRSGNMLVAAVVNHPDNASTTGNNQDTQLMGVARVAPDGSTTEWAVAGYCDTSMGLAGTGKPLLDGPGGGVAGRLVSLDNVTGGGVMGPSLGCPMIDAAGNLFFTAGLEVFSGANVDPGSGLVRAVYDEATFSYELELIFDTGLSVHGPNSDADYQLRYLDIADSNSISSAGAFSGNIQSGTFNDVDLATLTNEHPHTLRGLILNMQIVYDADNDGDFEVQTGSSGVPNSSDEDYRVVLYLSPSRDCNQNGTADDVDILNGTSIDLNGDELPDECEVSLGQNYCIGQANSTGVGGSISATGSGSVAANDMTVRADGMPPTQPGLFFYGPEQAIVPFGNGFRCVGAGSAGIARLGVEVSSAAGILLHNVDMTSPPTLATQITGGSTWNFQAWYRDPAAGGAFFNLSDGLEVSFAP